MSQIVSTSESKDVVFGSSLELRRTAEQQAPRRPGPRDRLQALRGRAPRLALALVVALVGVVVLDSLVGGLIHRARQGQLLADFRTPRNFTAEGRAIAIVQIPKIGLSEVVVEGVGPPQLRAGPGHLPASAVPGADGNAVVMGHKRRFGGPFGDVSKLVEGDEVYVQPKGTSEVVLYRVSAVVPPGDGQLDLLAPGDDTRLTLVTSAGGWLSSERLVVQAVADAPAKRLPPAGRPARAPSSMEPSGDLVNMSLVLAIGWSLLAFGLLRWMPRTYPARVRLFVAAAPLALGATLLWLEVDRWLAATL